MPRTIARSWKRCHRKSSTSSTSLSKLSKQSFILEKPASLQQQQQHYSSMPTSSHNSSISSSAIASSSTSTTTRWKVHDASSFASVEVILPPGKRLDTESDAVVSMSDNITVQGQMTGGILGSLARLFLTQESFFTTKVGNTSYESVGDVLLAPSSCGGIILHNLERGQDLLLIKGSYLASDTSVQLTSEIQSRNVTNSLFSGTGLFLLRAHTSDATTNNSLAIASHGSIHKYVLGRNMKRIVDNGHILAWTANMAYTTTLANKSSIWGSVSSGEGLMCEFTGPGTLYVQSHKPNFMEDGGNSDSGARRRGRGGSNPQRGSVGSLFGFGFFIVTMLTLYWIVSNLSTEANFTYTYSPNHAYTNDYDGAENYRRRIKPSKPSYSSAPRKLPVGEF